MGVEGVTDSLLNLLVTNKLHAICSPFSLLIDYS